MTTEWAEAVQKRMRSLGISNRALATACNKSESTIRRWLSGADEPKGSDVRRIAERLDEDPLSAFIRLGWLPGAASDGLKLRMVDQRIRQAILRQVQVDAEPRTPLGAFVDKVASEPGWAAITSHVDRGVDYRVQFEDHVELLPTRKRTSRPQRDEVNEYLDPLMSVHDAHWCDDPVVIMGTWSDGVIKVPRVLAARPSEERSSPRAPASVVVVGSHWTGNAKVGSLLATALGYGFVRLTTAARLAYGVRAHTPDRRADRVEVAQTLFRDPEGVGRQVVWAMSMDEATEVLPPAIESGDSAERPFVVYCRPNDQLIDFSARRTSALQTGGPSKRDLDEQRDLLDRTIARARGRTVTVEAVRAMGRGTTQDQYWDEHVRLFSTLVDAVGTDWALDATDEVVADVVARWH